MRLVNFRTLSTLAMFAIAAQRGATLAIESGLIPVSNTDEGGSTVETIPSVNGASTTLPVSTGLAPGPVIPTSTASTNGTNSTTTSGTFSVITTNTASSTTSHAALSTTSTSAALPVLAPYHFIAGTVVAITVAGMQML